MIPSKLLLSILSFILFLDIAGIIIFWNKRHAVKFSNDDNEFIKYNFDKACTTIQKDYLDGIKKIWNTFEFILNKKKYKGTLDEKIDKASQKLVNEMEIKALRAWSSDLTQSSFIEPEQIKHFVEILKQEMQHLGARI